MVVANKNARIGIEVFAGADNIKRIICSERTAVSLSRDIAQNTVARFIARLYGGMVEEEEKPLWFEFIKNHLTVTFEIAKNVLFFYRLAIEQGWITPDNVDGILEMTDSVECRALLLAYRKELL